MASTSFGGSIKLQGEAEYKRALKDIKQGLKEVSSELKLTTNQYASNSKDMGALQKSSKDMTKNLTEQKKALSELKGMYSNMNKEYSNHVKETQKLQKQYDAESKTLAKIEKELGTTSKEYQDQAKVVDDLDKAIKSNVAEEEKMQKSLRGMKTEMNNAEASIVDTENKLDKLGDTADKTGGKFDKLKSVVGTSLKAIGSVMAVAGATAVKLGKDALENYASYEQLVGGVETLFGTNGKSLEEYAQGVGKSVDEVNDKYGELQQAQAMVMKNAQNAYKSAGMSANEYMETVTGFSASLISSLGGDTLKASEVADMAIKDMSDNANKMGTDIGSIQNAYQGFAKQNYNMLDNLKLGYGGTKEEMKRLLEDAQKISGIEYNMDNLKDVYEAIHVIQNEMGITGATMREAEGTIEGSTASMKASWQNLMTGIADDNANFGGLMDSFTGSLVTVFKNILPRIKTITTGIGQLFNGLITEILPQILAEIPPLITELLPVLIDAVHKIVKGLTDQLPQFLKLGIEVVSMLIDGLSEMLPELIIAVSDMIPDIIDVLVEGMPKLLDGAIKLFMGIISAIPIIIERLTPEIPRIIDTIVDMLLNNIDTIVDASIQLFNGIVIALPKILKILVLETPKIAESIGKALIKSMPVLLGNAFAFFNVLWEALKDVSKMLLNQLPIIVAGFIDGLITPLKNAFKAGWENIKTIFSGFKVFFDELWGKIKATFATLGQAIGESISGAVKKAINGVLGIIEKNINTAVSLINGAIGLINKIPGVSVGKLSNVSFPRLAKGGIVESPTMAEVGEQGREAIVPLENNKGWIKELAGELANTMVLPMIRQAKVAEPKQQNMSYKDMVNAFKQALQEVTVELDDEEVGHFVTKTVANAIYT